MNVTASLLGLVVLAWFLPGVAFAEGATEARRSGEDRPKVSGPVTIDLGACVLGDKSAIGFWPSTVWGQQAPGDPTGVEAHLVPLDDLDRELVRPAGMWHRDLEPGRYVYWLEGPGTISPSPGMINQADSGKRGFAVISHMGWAGRVNVELPPAIPEGAQVRMQGLDAYMAGENMGFLLWRRADLARARGGLQMPAGRVLASLWDPAESAYVAHSRPVVADPARPAVTRLSPPAAGTSDLLVALRRPKQALRVLDDDVSLALHTADGNAVAPEVYGRANDRVIAVWYGVAPGTAELRVSSSKTQLPPTFIELRRDRIERHEGRLEEAPNLRIALDLPAIVDGVEPVVTLAQAPRWETIVRETLPAAERELVLQVPPTILDVAAEIGPWRLTKRVDLRDGADAEVTLRAEGVLVSGSVLRGEHFEPGAKLIFGYEEEGTITTLSTEDGSYELLLPRAGWWPVGVRLAGRSTAAVVILEVDEPDSEGIDILVPDNEWVVAVKDATTGEAVQGATVAIANKAAEDGFRTWMRGDTDEAGEAILHPLRPGMAEISARAAGYREQPPRMEEVPEGTDLRRFVLELEPESEAVALSITLADGSPAVGAVAACASPDGSVTAEHESDADGKVRFEPPRPGIDCLLLVRHPQAAPWAGKWRGEAQTIRLRTPGAPLNLLVSGSGGPVPWAGIFVWIEGYRLDGQALAFFADQRAAADRDGLWSLGRTPPGDLRVLAVAPSLGRLAQSGALDSQGAIVSPAGQGIVELAAIR
jgi:hypothetical protein